MRHGLGALVILNSGGPVMLVVDVEPASGQLTAAWRDDSGRVTERSLPQVCVRHPLEPPPPVRLL